MEIFGMHVEAGKKMYKNVKIGELANFSDFSIPVLVACGAHEGPTLWMTGAVHGDELNGPWALRQFFWDLNPQQLYGNIVITPLLNVLAFADKNKISHIDNLDLDQQFPGNPNGSYTQRIAYVVFNEMKKWANFVIDFHTMGHVFSSTPYTVSKDVPGVDSIVTDKAFKLARIFGVYPNCHLNLATAGGELPGTTSGSIDITCLHHNIPCFMAEMGAGGRWDEQAIQVIRDGIDNVLKYTGMIKEEYKKPGKQMIITDRYFLRCNHGGFVRMAVAPGQLVQKDEKLASIYDFWDERETMTAKKKLFVIAVRHEPVVTTGDRMGFVGCEWHEVEW
ncbi:MAG: M14 family metallopeptidase [Megasphaera sp.]|jgi:predicted deacylase|nr:M14 family metallopeptidase [Megasphaera sp.]